MRASRLLSILMLLQLRGRMSAVALAAELGVTVRTVYRDVDQLSAAGVPVYAERGRRGGFALLAGYQTRLTGLSGAESELLGLMDIASAAEALGFDRQPEEVRQKILASLPHAQGSTAARIAARFHLDPVPWYGRRPTPDVLRALAAAVWTDREIEIEYESWKGLVMRRLTPLGLVMKAGDWYCVAAAQGDARTYNVASIRSLAIGEPDPRRLANFDLARHWAQRVEAFEQSLLTRTAGVRISTAGMRLLRDQQPSAWQHAQAQASGPDAAGWITTELRIESGAQGVREILRLGAEIEVIEPDELRQAVSAEAARLLLRYRPEPLQRTN